uniref:EGF-like domain-containing protein n=1 Tax=Magallana gigas TaxID=29159 RepID=A0A8W8NCK9_MAGGI
MTCFRGIELRIIVFIFLLIPQCSSIFCSSQNRKINSNGTACTELEHCVSSFNPQTGECLGPGNQCDPGWMGPGCQYGK